MSTLSRSASLRLFPSRPIAHAQLSLCRESQLRGASRTGGSDVVWRETGRRIRFRRHVCSRSSDPERGANLTGFAKSTDDLPPAASIPEGRPSLESVLCTDELRRRTRRPPDYGKENCALLALASVLANSRYGVLQTLAHTIVDIIGRPSLG
jgi:hypothetical protein